MLTQATVVFSPDGMSGHSAGRKIEGMSRDGAHNRDGISIATEAGHVHCRFHHDDDAYDDGLVHSHGWAANSEER
jgi:hypothetical protein